MIKIILQWIALAIAVLAAAYIVPGISVASFQVALLVAAVFGLINVFIKPVFRILTLPINVLTLGIFGVILNVVLFWVVTLIVPGFTISGFIPALLGSIVIAIIMWLIDMVF